MSRRVVALLSLLALVVVVTWWRGGGDETSPDVRRRVHPTVNASSAQSKRDRPPPREMEASSPSSGAKARRPDMGGEPDRVHAQNLDPVKPQVMQDQVANSADAEDDAADSEDPEAEALAEEIRTALEDPEPTNRAAAISNLGLVDDFGPVVPVLQRAAADPDPDVKLAVLSAMGSMGTAVPQNLVEQYAKDPDPDIRLEALSIAEQLLQEDDTPPYVEPLLRAATKDKNKEVRDSATEILEGGWKIE